MGCCQSNASRDEAQNAHHNLQNQVPVPQAANRPNRRIRAPSLIARSPRDVTNQMPPWPRTHLERQRQVFFETRTNGSDEVWAALRRASEMLVAGDLDGAQAIVDAAGVTCPSGRFAKGRGRNRNRGGLFDERGTLYDIPNWVVTDPQDIREDGDDKIAAADDGAEESDEDAEAAQRRDAKGKGRAVDLGEEVTVKIRIHDVGDFNVFVGSKQTAGTVTRKVFEQHGKTVQLIWRGKKVDDKLTLEAQGWQTGDTVLAYLTVRVEEGPCYGRD